MDTEKMILEEETFRKFGYYSTDWGRTSRKHVIAKCEDCGKIREIRKGTHTPFCTSCWQKGERNWNYGKKASKETREKMRLTHTGKHTGILNPMYGTHHTEE